MTLDRMTLALAFSMAALAAQAQETPKPQDGQAKAAEKAQGGPLADQALGLRFQVTQADLPPPNTGPVVSNAPLVVPREGRTLNVPDGFEVTAFAENLTHPRQLLVLPNGDVIVAEQKAGYLTLLRDGDGDGKAEWVQRHAEGFQGPYGLAWRDGKILVADQVGIWEVPHELGQVRAAYGHAKPIGEVPPDERKPSPQAFGQTLITEEGVFGLMKGHSNRDLEIDPKTGALFVGVGSSGNIGTEPPVKATIQRFAPDGSGQSTWASGLRNATGLAFHPETGDLYAVVQERDGLGDGLVPDYLTRVQEGEFYGWPYAYSGSNPQPGFADMAPEMVKRSRAPDLMFEAHSAAMDLVFHDGKGFPEEYKGDAFVVLKGSWNRSDPTGYKIVHVPFEDGRPVGWYENFATGFWVSGEDRAEVWGRPADIAVAADGALLIADDTSKSVWRVARKAAERQEPPMAEQPSGAARSGG